MMDSKQNNKTFKNSGIVDLKCAEAIPKPSTIEVIKFEYRWTIQNFREKVNKDVISAAFPNRTDYGMNWSLTLLSSTPLKKYSQLLAIKLTLVSSNVSVVDAVYQFGIITRFDSCELSQEESRIFKNKNYINVELEVPITCKFGTLLDNVTILCKIMVPVHQENNPHILVPTKQKYQFDSTEFGILFENQRFSDFTLCVNGKELQVHKVVLAAKSPVFNAMFEHDMVENKKCRVEITDIEYDILKDLVHFIYTDGVSNLEEKAKDLLVAADRYGVEGLKVKCESVLCNHVSIDNAAEMFIFSDTVTATNLREVAKNYIVSHSKEISATSGFQSMLGNNKLFELVSEICFALATI